MADITVKDPWVRATVPQQKATGAFMQITTPRSARLVDVRSSAAGVTEIPITAFSPVGVSMSSLMSSVNMGMPTSPLHPAHRASWLVSLACLSAGLALTSSHHVPVQVAGLCLAGASGWMSWRAHSRMRRALDLAHHNEATWQACMQGSQDAVMVLERRNDMMGRFMGYTVVQANHRAHQLFRTDGLPLVGQLLKDVLPEGEGVVMAEVDATRLAGVRAHTGSGWAAVAFMPSARRCSTRTRSPTAPLGEGPR